MFQVVAEPKSRGGKVPAVNCPGCGGPMAPATLPSLPADRIDVTYRCGRCAAETARTFRCEPA